MLLRAQPIFDAFDAIEKKNPRVILLDPAGKQFDQAYAEDLAQEEELIFICGHYEGYDERIKTLVTDEISIGDYVLTGGELAAMTMIDATVRLIPDLGKLLAISFISRPLLQRLKIRLTLLLKKDIELS